ncbi:LysR family transcriptional regulator [Spirillospora sp. NPDC052242]
MLRLVHRYGTVTSAAEAMHLTPSAVSHHLREPGRELKAPLLEPQGRRVRLTPAALVLVGHADALLARWEETVAEGAVRVPLVGDAVPRRRLLTCVRRGGRGNPIVELGLRALRDAVPAPCTRLPAA